MCQYHIQTHVEGSTRFHDDKFCSPVDLARIGSMQDLFSTAANVGPMITPVSEFVRQIRRHLEGHFPLGWISGEVSGLTRAGSGHIYFTLKDAEGQMRCVMWRTRAQLLPFEVREGTRIEVRAQVTIYEPRGDMQLVVEQIRHAGQGNLFEAFMRLKARLEAEGLFDADLKRELPRYPRRIGLVTSPAAAALRDVLTTLHRRAPGLQVVLYPSAVQGERAGEQLAEAILTASARHREDRIEALIVCRGGGSLEDLWAFNHEALVRALRACAIPVVSGVGHETDTTLCDFAADARAATPTAAAELLTTSLLALRQALPRQQADLQRLLGFQLREAAQTLDLLEHRLVHPRQRIERLRADLSQMQLRMQHAIHNQLGSHTRQLATLDTRFARHRPETRALRQRLGHLGERLATTLRQQQSRRQQHLEALARGLTHLGPESVLQRGYAIVRDETGQIVRDADALASGDAIELLLARGKRQARVS